MFDELTESDLQPVRAVNMPGRPAAPTSTGGKLANQYAPTSAGGASGRRASGDISTVGKRIGGAFVDGLFIGLISLIGFGIAVAVEAASPTPEGQEVGFTSPSFIAFLLVALVPQIINWILIAKSGQSVGKKAVGTVIVDAESGVPVGFVQGVLKRQFLFGLLTSIPFVGGLIALADLVYLFLADHQTLHDKLANTYVVDVR